ESQLASGTGGQPRAGSRTGQPRFRPTALRPHYGMGRESYKEGSGSDKSRNPRGSSAPSRPVGDDIYEGRRLQKSRREAVGIAFPSSQRRGFAQKIHRGRS